MYPQAIHGEASALANLTIETEAQQVLDELWTEKLIPFALSVGKITKDLSAYTIHFYDSRIRTARVQLAERALFRETVRSAVLARVTQLSGPLKDWQQRPNQALKA
jgi:hypothetical protein